MVDYREILRLAEQGSSQRQIAASVRSSHHTVKEVIETAEQHGIRWPIDGSVSNEMLMSVLFPEKYTSISGYLEPDFAYIHKELAKPKVTLTLLWDEYRTKAESLGKKPYMPTRV